MIKRTIFPGVVFPEVLTAEKEKMYIDMSKKGDFKARNILVEHNMRLLIFIINNIFPNTHVSDEDLIGLGEEALIKAVNTFDSEKNIKLSTYIYRCIKNFIIYYLKSNPKEKTVSLDAPVAIGSDGDLLLRSDVISSQFNTIENVDKKLELEEIIKIINSLSEREKAVLKGLLGIDCEQIGQNELAKEIKESQANISRIKKITLLKIKNRLQSKEKNKEIDLKNSKRRNLPMPMITLLNKKGIVMKSTSYFNSDISRFNFMVDNENIPIFEEQIADVTDVQLIQPTTNDKGLKEMVEKQKKHVLLSNKVIEL